MLVYLDNLYEEAISENSQIKEQTSETAKRLNEEAKETFRSHKSWL